VHTRHICVCGIEYILTYKLRRLPSPTTEEVPRWWEGRFRLPGGRGAVWEQILKIENVAPFSGKITICLRYLVLVLMLMRGSEF
jgi:hypothetical protein